MNTTDNPISNHASYVPAQVACSWQESQIYMLQSAFFSIGGKLGFRKVKQGVDVYTHNYQTGY